MGITFTADEIFEMAGEIERNGAKFYRKAAGGPAGAPAREILLRLADMEVQHEKTFAAMRAELSASDRASSSFDPEGEAALFLQAVADGHVFNIRSDPSSKLTGHETLPDIFRAAIGLEKDSIVFYLGMQDLVGKELGRPRIAGIIREEMSHVAILSGELSRVE